MYQKAKKGWKKHLDFILLDLLCLFLSYILVYGIRNRMPFPWQNQLYRNILAVFFCTQILVSLINNTFKNVLKRGYLQEAIATLKHVCLIVLLVSFYLFLIQNGGAYPRLVLLCTGGCDLVLSYTVRCLWKHHVQQTGEYIGKASLLIVTTCDLAEEVVKNIKSSNYARFKIVGIALLDSEKTGADIEGVPVVASRETVDGYICREWVDEVFINIPIEQAYPQELIDDFVAMGVTTHFRLMEVFDAEGQKQGVERLGGYTVLTSSINMASASELFYKRCLDILGGIVGCLLTGILYIGVAPAIYFQSPGPIFFSQVRVGKNGKKFKIYKFRSMYMDAEERKKELMKQNRVKDGMMFKLDDDPRIIGGEKGIGGIIRKYSIDEFPQFWNVLKGDMSLVGTRPPTIDEWEKYDLHHRARLAIKPGITGMWQVSGRSGITDFEEVVRLDRQYIINWSIWLDIKILFKTVLVVLAHDGSM